ncbi:extracellular solute-binding protein [Paenibacillus antri]|uniref:Extracellular solute-binding protein n=1 Tax=Paenibacillus antri TaxID=2582848 RepID=A0A5R9GK86_9BACL|nr:extracellular solute-binding protein [Paenibacillus antri]TLS53878.1 extracellular solute-binding protein [Paenibacillus antri]
MGKQPKVLAVLLSAMTLMLGACTGGTANPATVDNASGKAVADANNSDAEPSTDAPKPAAPTKLALWTFQEVHAKYYNGMAESWNAANPNKPIELEVTTLPDADMHSKLLISLQSGVGAPDLSDIEISKFPNFLRGDIPLAELNDVIDPVKDNIVQARVDMYAKDGKYYGVDFHVGASVMYYNKEILDQAGVNADDIVTWADFVEAGKTVLAKTGKPMTAVETIGEWQFWQMISQQGSDFLDADGNVILDNEINVKTVDFLKQMIKDEVAVIAPGGKYHTEDFYGFMNGGGAAAIAMPMWFMGRFTDYMPDLSGKMIIRPLPSWEPGGNRSAGMGGTGTAVIKSSPNAELAKEFLAYTKLSKEGNIEIWKQLGFDPIRKDVWELPELKEENKFTAYFGTNLFDTLMEVKDEIHTVNIKDKTPQINAAVKTIALFQAIQEGKDTLTTLKTVADVIRK